MTLYFNSVSMDYIVVNTQVKKSNSRLLKSLLLFI